MLKLKELTDSVNGSLRRPKDVSKVIVSEKTNSNPHHRTFASHRPKHHPLHQTKSTPPSPVDHSDWVRLGQLGWNGPLLESSRGLFSALDWACEQHEAQQRVQACVHHIDTITRNIGLTDPAHHINEPRTGPRLVKQAS